MPKVSFRILVCLVFLSSISFYVGLHLVERDRVFSKSEESTASDAKGKVSSDDLAHKEEPLGLEEIAAELRSGKATETSSLLSSGIILDERFSNTEDPNLRLRERLLSFEETGDYVVAREFIDTEGSEQKIWLQEAFLADSIIANGTVERIDELLVSHGLFNRWRTHSEIVYGFVSVKTDDLSLDGVDELLEILRSGTEDHYFEPDYLYFATETVPNDPGFNDGSQWGLKAWENGDVGINAPAAWENRNDTASVVVAIVDSGIDLEHEDLLGNLWTNEGEIRGNGIDDDGNGFIDDFYGYSSFNEVDPVDDLGHGTSVAGVVGAAGNNGRGGTGVAWKTSLMALKFISKTGYGTASGAAKCIDYADANNARVLNASWSGRNRSTLLSVAITRYTENGGLFVAAAGNDGASLARWNTYPASLSIEGLVAVGSINQQGKLSPFSNYGERVVRLLAPGEGIWTTQIGDDKYGSVNGTSFSAPFVSGAAALLFAEYGDDTAEDQIARLRASGKALDIEEGIALYPVLFDLDKALALLRAPYPPFLRRQENEKFEVLGGVDYIYDVKDFHAWHGTDYQWYRDDVRIETAAEANLALPQVRLEQEGVYRLVAINEFGTDELSFTLSVLPARPDISVALDGGDIGAWVSDDYGWEVVSDPEVKGGSHVSISLEKEGAGHLFLGNLKGSLVRFRARVSASGGGLWLVSSNSLHKHISVGTYWKEFEIKISDSLNEALELVARRSSFGDSETVEIELDSFSSYPPNEAPPFFETQSVEVKVREGNDAVLSVRATHATDVETFVWYRNGVKIGETSSTEYPIEGASFEDEGLYQIEATNAFGTARSLAMRVSVVHAFPTINADFDDLYEVTEGDRFVLDAEVNGYEGVEYQWTHYGNPLDWALSDTLVIEDLTMGNSGDYQLEVSFVDELRGTRTILSKRVYLTVLPSGPIPAFFAWPYDATEVVDEGGFVSIERYPQGARPITYQWYKDDIAVEGGNSRALKFDVVSHEDEGIYRLKATNAYGEAWSGESILLISEPVDVAQVWGENSLLKEVTGNLLERVECLECTTGFAVRSSVVPVTVDESYGLLEGEFDSGGYPVRLQLEVEGAGHSRVLLLARNYQIGLLYFDLYEGLNTVALPPLTDESNYSFSVSHEEGTVTLLNVERAMDPVLILHDERVTRQQDAAILIDEKVESYGAVTYQWFHNGNPIEGEVTSRLLIPEADQSIGDEYWLEAWNDVGRVVCDKVTIVPSIEPWIAQVLGDGVSVETVGPALYHTELEEGSLVLKSGVLPVGATTKLSVFGIAPGLWDLDVGDLERRLLTTSSGAWASYLSPGESIVREGDGISLSYRSFDEAFLELVVKDAERIPFPVVTRDLVDHSLVGQSWYGIEVEVFPKPETFEWYKNDELVYTETALGESSSLWSDSPDGLEGKYYCKAIYEDGEISSRVATIGGADLSDALGSAIDEALIQSTSSWYVKEDVTAVSGKMIESAGDSVNISFSVPENSLLSFRIQFEDTVKLDFRGRLLNYYLENAGGVLSSDTSGEWRTVTLLVPEGEGNVDFQLNTDTRRGSEVRLRIDDFRIDPASGFVSHPHAQYLVVGERLELTSRFVHQSEASFQWYRDGVAIAGADEVSFILPKVNSSDFGRYYVEAVGAWGTAKSESADVLWLSDSLAAGFGGAIRPTSIESMSSNLAVDKVISAFSANEAIRIDLPPGDEVVVRWPMVGKYYLGVSARASEDGLVDVETNFPHSYGSAQLGASYWSFIRSAWLQYEEGQSVEFRFSVDEGRHFDKTDTFIELSGGVVGVPGGISFDKWKSLEAESANLFMEHFSLDPIGDADGDSLLDGFEFLLGLDPRSPTEMPMLDFVELDGESYFTLSTQVRRSLNAVILLEEWVVGVGWKTKVADVVELNLEDRQMYDCLWKFPVPENGDPVLYRWRALFDEGSLSTPF